MPRDSAERMDPAEPRSPGGVPFSDKLDFLRARWLKLGLPAKLLLLTAAFATLAEVLIHFLVANFRLSWLNDPFDRSGVSLTCRTSRARRRGAGPHCAPICCVPPGRRRWPSRGMAAVSSTPPPVARPIHGSFSRRSRGRFLGRSHPPRDNEQGCARRILYRRRANTARHRSAR